MLSTNNKNRQKKPDFRLILKPEIGLEEKWAEFVVEG